jgi:nucleoside-diphosphate-sugar epimerase
MCENMSPRKRVLVTGATGFIGGRICERLFLGGTYDVRALVHTPAKAARVARLPIEICRGDLLDPGSVRAAVDGCALVVHAAVGSPRATVRGTQALLDACSRSGVERFVLLSSVRVYGLYPPAAAVSETAEPRPGRDPYARMKLAQERMTLAQYRTRGLPVVILRPTNVFGPYDRMSVDLVRRLRTRQLALVDGGTGVCNLVYVDNLVDVIELALERQHVVGETFFVSDDEPISWRQCLEDYARIAGVSTDLPNISSADVDRVHRRRRPRLLNWIKRSGNYLVSADAARLLRRAPLPASIKAKAQYAVDALLPAVKEAVRGDRRFLALWERDRPGSLPPDIDEVDDYFLVQTRTVVHEVTKARTRLGYRPRYARPAALELTRAWLDFAGHLTA